MLAALQGGTITPTDSIYDYGVVGSAAPAIGDVVSHNLARLAIKRIDRGLVFSPEGEGELNLIHAQILNLIQLEITCFATGSFASVSEGNRKSKKRLIESINQLGQESVAQRRLRLSARRSSSIGASSIHQDAVRDSRWSGIYRISK